MFHAVLEYFMLGFCYPSAYNEVLKYVTCNVARSSFCLRLLYELDILKDVGI